MNVEVTQTFLLSEHLKNRSKQGLTYLLVFLLSGFLWPISILNAASKNNAIPILRHRPPSPLSVGEKMVIVSIVESSTDLVQVVFLYRVPGSGAFQKMVMTPRNEGFFEVRLEITKKFSQGIEYYIEAINKFGNKGRDGSRTKPYFVEVRQRKRSLSIVKNVLEEEEKGKKPFWKKTWFWLAVVAVAGGGIAAAGAGGGGKEGNTGTVTLE